MKKVIVGLLVFLAGIIFSACFDTYFRNLIQDLFIRTTHNKIQFFGKNFQFFSATYYYITFGLSFLFFWLLNRKYRIKKGLINLAFFTLMFFVFLLIVCALYANLKVIECTNCTDGIRRIHYNGIPYNLILSSCMIFSIITLFIKEKVFKKKEFNGR